MFILLNIKPALHLCTNLDLGCGESLPYPAFMLVRAVNYLVVMS